MAIPSRKFAAVRVCVCHFSLPLHMQNLSDIKMRTGKIPVRRHCKFNLPHTVHAYAQHTLYAPALHGATPADFAGQLMNGAFLKADKPRPAQARLRQFPPHCPHCLRSRRFHPLRRLQAQSVSLTERTLHSPCRSRSHSDGKASAVVSFPPSSRYTTPRLLSMVE